MKHVCILLFAFLLFTSCEDTKEDFQLDDFGYEYYPMESDKYWIYQVDSVLYSDVGAVKDSTTSYLKEEIVEKFVDQLGDTTYRIERSFSATLDYDWKVTDQWATQKSASQVTRTEENLKYIKLIFPMRENKTWDGNAFIDESQIVQIGGEMLQFFLYWDYKILSVDQMEEIGGIVFDSVSTIQNAESLSEAIPDVLHRRFALEKYAKNVGLIYKKHLILDTQCIEECEGQTWEEKAEEGYTMEITLLEYGQ